MPPTHMWLTAGKATEEDSMRTRARTNMLHMYALLYSERDRSQFESGFYIVIACVQFSLSLYRVCGTIIKIECGGTHTHIHTQLASVFPRFSTCLGGYTVWSSHRKIEMIMLLSCNDITNYAQLTAKLQSLLPSAKCMAWPPGSECVCDTRGHTTYTYTLCCVRDRTHIVTLFRLIRSAEFEKLTHLRIMTQRSAATPGNICSRRFPPNILEFPYVCVQVCVCDCPSDTVPAGK